jgi:hypothetical protein
MMARASIVAVVEGVDDHLFYDSLLQHYFRVRGTSRSIQIRTPREVDADADGKNALINIFKFFRARGRLASSSGNKRLLFFADQDYDGISRRKLRSKHFIYSPGVSFENCLYECGDLGDSIDALLSRRIDKNTFLPVADFSNWKKTCANYWMDWVVYCVAAEVSGVAPRKNRGGSSSIHQGYPPVLKQGEPARLRSEFALALGSAAEAMKYWTVASRTVQRAIASGQVDKVFCGKWFPFFLREEVAKLGGRYATLAARVNKGRALASQLLRDLTFRGVIQDYYFSLIDRALI